MHIRNKSRHKSWDASFGTRSVPTTKDGDTNEDLTSRSAANSEFGLCRHIRQHDMQSMLLRVIGCFQGICAAGKLRFGMLGRPVINHHLDELPPRCVGTFPRMEIQANGGTIRLAGERLSEILSMLVAKGVAVIEVD